MRSRVRIRSLIAMSVVGYFIYVGSGGWFAAAFSTPTCPLNRFSINVSRKSFPSSTRDYGRGDASLITFRKRRHESDLQVNLIPLQARQWEGDDIRWVQKIRRRLSVRANNLTPAKTTLIVLNTLFFVYQVVNAVDYLRRRHPEYWPGQALAMIGDVLMGTSILGPFSADFVHEPKRSRIQPHRYLTSGFLHVNLIHLLVNMSLLQKSPKWLETGLGWKLFVSTFLFGIVSGNVWDSWSTLDTTTMPHFAGGGICALYGLFFCSIIKMGNSSMGIRVFKSMGIMLMLGILIPNVSNAAHIGGFLGGILMGILCCPNYRKSYSLSRKNSLEVDFADREYRLAMGFGKVPSRRGLVPLSLLWVVAIIALASNPLYRRMPMNIYRGLLEPGIHSNMRHISVSSATL